MKIHSYIALLLIASSTNLNGQTHQKNLIQKFTTAKGLSSNYVYQTIQDQHGFIWTGTEEGLTKFDGKTFISFSTRKGRYEITHNRTQALMLAPDGNVWAGTSSGLNIYDYPSDSIIQVTESTSPRRLIYNDITSLTMSRNQLITWIGTYGSGVHYFDWQSQQFNILELQSEKDIPPPLNVMSLLEDDNRRLWIGTQYNGIYKYNIQTGRLDYLPVVNKELFIRSIYQDSFKRIWIGTSAGLFVYNENLSMFEPVNYPEMLSRTSIGAIHEDQTGKLWIGSENFLMNIPVRFFSRTEKFPFQVYEHGESASKLNSPSVNSIFADRDNNLWIGTAWGGLNMLRGIPLKFELIKHEPDEPSSLPGLPILSMCKNNENEVIIGTNGGGIFRLNLNTGKAGKVITRPNLDFLIVQSLIKDRDGNCWIGTYNNGLYKLNASGTVMQQFKDEGPNGLRIPNNDVRSIYQDSKGRIWIGTGNGMSMYNPSSGKIEQQVVFQTRTGIRVIREDKSEKLWLGTYGAGVITYDMNTGRINYNPTPMSSLVVSDISLNNEHVWVATHGNGLMYFNVNTKKTVTISEEEGLASNYVRSIMLDKNDVLWMGTSKGISEYKPETGEIRNYNVQDGVQANELSARCAIMLPDGQLLFGGLGGINRFDPMLVTKDDYCPPVVFTRLSVFNQLVRPSSGKSHSPLKVNISLAREIKLKHNQSVFAIDFIGINFNANEKIQYAYFLEGSDKDWNYIGTQNSITFRNLKPGQYNLQVKASSPDAIWIDDNIAEMSIIVRPPYWKSWWAIILYFILTATVMYFIWQYSTLRIRSANILKIERAKREQEEELHQEKLQFFTNISHEFRTPLTLLMGPLEELKNKIADEALQSQIKSMIKNTKRMLFMVNQLLDFRKTEKGQMLLRVSYSDLVAFVNDIIAAYKDMKVKKNIRLEFQHEEPVLMTWFDGEFLEKALYNILTNAFKFTSDGGSIIINAQFAYEPSGNKQIQISIIDNGLGIAPGDLPFIFDRFYQGKNNPDFQSSGSGIGLHLTRNLIELHHGNISVESEPGVRTAFVITLPADEASYSYIEISDDNNRKLERKPIDFEIDEAEYTDHQELKKKQLNRILIVEDHPEIRKYIIETLGKSYIFDEADNGLEALRMTSEQSYDLIITDLMMPGMDGIELCKILKSNIETDHIPIVMLTAKSSMENRIEGLDVGADSYITKPFYPDHLRVRVTRLIDQRSLFRQRFSQNIIIQKKPNTQLSETNQTPDQLFIQKVVNVILDKLLVPDFNGDMLAKEIGISRMGLHRKIKALTDQSTGEFIRNIRLSKSCELLLIPGKNISEICYEVGFNSPSYFTTCFTELYKQTPTEYIKSFQQKV